MNRCITWIVSLLVISPALAQTVDYDTVAQSSAKRLAVGTCAGCHGASGISTMPKFPVLAAQQTSYLVRQLKAFKSQTRGDPDARAFMWGIAASLDDAQIVELAQYYSSQRAHTASADQDREAVARGREIFEHGIESQKVPNCSLCHGLNGEGIAAVPRIAGQHSQYFLSQMTSFQLNLRDDGMREIASNLKPSNLSDLAAYVRSR